MSDWSSLSGAPGGGTPPAAGLEAVRPRWGYREILVFAAIGVLAQMLALLAGESVARSFGVEGSEAFADLLRSDPAVAVPLQFLSWLPPLGYVAYVVTAGFRSPLASGLAWTRPSGPLRSYARAGALLALGSLLAAVAIGDPTQDNPMRELFARRESLWILAAFGIVVAPVFEEIVFRGFLFAAFERLHGRWSALAVTSLVFAGLHGAQYGWHWQQLVILTGVGGAFGGVRMSSGSAKASAVAHAAYNALLFLVAASLPAGLG